MKLAQASRWTWLVYVVLCAGALIILFPMYLTLVTAFKTPTQSANNFFSFPANLYLGNYVKVFEANNVFIYILNSLLITIISVAVIVIFTPMVAYAISRNFNRKYYKFLYFYIVAGIFIPFQVIMLPIVKLMTKLHLLDQFGLILLYITYALIRGVFLSVGYLKSIPLELEEAAFLDGCSVWKTFTQIVYPLMKPMTVTLAIINCLWIWNDFLLPLLILNKSHSFWTLPLFQYNFKSQYSFDYNVAFSSFVLSILPIMILYAFLQKHIIGGLTEGSVKN